MQRNGQIRLRQSGGHNLFVGGRRRRVQTNAKTDVPIKGRRAIGEPSGGEKNVANAVQAEIKNRSLFDKERFLAV